MFKNTLKSSFPEFLNQNTLIINILFFTFLTPPPPLPPSTPTPPPPTPTPTPRTLNNSNNTIPPQPPSTLKPPPPPPTQTPPPTPTNTKNAKQQQQHKTIPNQKAETKSKKAGKQESRCRWWRQRGTATKTRRPPSPMRTLFLTAMWRGAARWTVAMARRRS
ncbi:uncharacterized protein DS421_9g262090 [Arachis hypogaea]|nr:uncharacterized protein DS421_9g262090 [Arachis hypogaea]